jgi:hypothetical protein
MSSPPVLIAVVLLNSRDIVQVPAPRRDVGRCRIGKREG